MRHQKDGSSAGCLRRHLQQVVAVGVEVAHVARHKALRPLKLLVQHVCRQPCVVPKLLLR